MPQLTFNRGLTLPSFLTARPRAFGSWQKKAKFHRTFRDIFAENGWFCGKFTEISTTNFAERWWEGNRRFCGIFLGTFRQKRIGFALIWQTSLTKKDWNLPIFVRKWWLLDFTITTAPETPTTFKSCLSKTGNFARKLSSSFGLS